MGGHDAHFGVILVKLYGKGRILTSKCIFPICACYERALMTRESIRSEAKQQNSLIATYN